MPHRIHFLQTTLGYIIEGTLLTIGLIWSGGQKVIAMLIDRETMDQLRSADGALFGAAVIVVALWLSKIADGKRMDKRHDEMISVMKESSARAERMLERNIKTNSNIAVGLNRLVNELDGRPCGYGKPLTPFNFDTEEEP